jgi:WD40 repeat protein
MSETCGPVEPRSSPYFGLDYYEEKFGAWFFGRETEGGRIITNLRAARLTLLHAESGVGKSSLLRAGVAWRMRKLADDSLARRGTVRSVPVVFSSWKDDPVLDLAVTIRAAIAPYLAGRSEPGPPTDRLDETIVAASSALNASLFIMLDQFEEYFLYRSREPVPEKFADELARCINRADLRANFLIAIREDAYAGLGDLFKGRIDNVYGNYLHVDYLDRVSAEKAIREPLDVYNSQPGVSDHVKIQDELVGAVLDQVRAFGGGDAQGPAATADGGGDRIATPLLQLVMDEVWKQERDEGSHELRLSTLQNLRGVRMIVDAHLGKALSSLNNAERQTAIDVFDHLVTPSGGKIAESVPDLAKRTGHGEDQVAGVLEKLDRKRIVRSIAAAPGQDSMRFRRYEIFHDVLAPTINRAIGAREERRRIRRLRRFAALGTALLVVLLALVGLFVYLWHSANTEKLTAESRQLAAEADLNVAQDPELSTSLALQALHLQDTSQAEDALRTALPEVQEIKVYQISAPVFSAVFDPANASRVVSAGNDGSVWMWDTKTGHRIMSLPPKGGFGQDGSADIVAFNPVGTEVAVGYSFGQVVIFDARSGKELHSTDAGSAVGGAQFDGNNILAIATKKGAYLWLPGNGSKPFQMLLNGANILSGANSIAVDPKNQLKFAAATDNGTVIFTLRQSDLGIIQHQTLNQGQSSGTGALDAEFSFDGQQVVTADDDGAVRVYDLTSSNEVMTLAATQGIPGSVAFSPNGRMIVAGYSSGAALVWDAVTGTELTQLVGNAGSVWSARFNADGSEVVTAAEDGTIRLWDAQPREVRTSFTSPSDGKPQTVYTAEYSPDGGRILTVDSSGNASVFTAGGKPVYSGGQPVVINPGETVDVNAAAFNVAGTEIVTADTDGSVDLWHASGSNYSQIQVPSPIHVKGPALYAAFGQHDSRIAVVTSNDTAEVFSATTGKLLQTLDPRMGFQLSVSVFSPDGRQILTGDNNGQVEVWDSATGKEIRALGTHGPQIGDVEFNRNGSQFVTASSAGVVTVWTAGKDLLKLSFDACPSPSTASFSPNASRIVVACGDGTVRVFDAATGHTMTAVSDPGVVSSAAYSPDGNSIVTAFQANNAGGVQIWNTELASTSLATLERLAEQRITGKLTDAERQEYLADISG